MTSVGSMDKLNYVAASELAVLSINLCFVSWFEVIITAVFLEKDNIISLNEIISQSKKLGLHSLKFSFSIIIFHSLSLLANFRAFI